MASNSSDVTTGLQLLSLQPGAALLRVPGEIRNKIYRYVLVSKTSIVVHVKGRCYNWPMPQVSRPSRAGPTTVLKLSPEHPPLILACRKTYEEARPIYYVENEFAFMESTLHPDAIQVFRRLAGNRNRDIPSLKVFRDFTSGPIEAIKNHFQIRFTVSMSESRIKIQMGRQNLSHREDDLPLHLQEGQDKLCAFDLLHLAERHSQTINVSSLLDFVEAYAGTIIAKGTLVETPVCERCYKLKCI